MGKSTKAILASSTLSHIKLDPVQSAWPSNIGTASLKISEAFCPFSMEGIKEVIFCFIVVCILNGFLNLFENLKLAA